MSGMSFRSFSVIFTCGVVGLRRSSSGQSVSQPDTPVAQCTQHTAKAPLTRKKASEVSESFTSSRSRSSAAVSRCSASIIAWLRLRLALLAEGRLGSDGALLMV